MWQILIWDLINQSRKSKYSKIFGSGKQPLWIENHGIRSQPPENQFRVISPPVSHHARLVSPLSVLEPLRTRYVIHKKSNTYMLDQNTGIEKKKKTESNRMRGTKIHNERKSTTILTKKKEKEISTLKP